MAMRLRLILLGALLSTSAGLRAEETRYRKLTVEAAEFTEAKVGIFHLELERTASYLALYAYREFAVKTAEGNAEARLQARRFVSLALHMDPEGIVPKRINEMLAAGAKTTLESPLPQEPKHFVAGLVRLLKQLQARTEPAAASLAGFLSLVAADMDATNEEAVYAAEVFAKKTGDLSNAWKKLAYGRTAATSEE
jgi:hypothetical protein